MTRADDMRRLWDVAIRIAVSLALAAIIAGGGFVFSIRDEVHAQDTRLVALEKTVPSMEIVEARFTAILIEMQSIKGDLRVIRTEIQGFRKQLDDLCRRVETLEKQAHNEGD